MKFGKTAIILLLAATAVGGAALAWRQYGELVELRAAAMNRNERADLQKRVWDLEKANHELQDQLAAHRDPGDLDGLLAAAESGRTPASRDQGGRSSRGERGGDSRGRGSSGFQQAAAVRELMNKPEVQAMVNLQHKAAVEARYATLFKNLNLPVEQIERLKTLLAERTITMQDIMVAAREQGINPRENPEAYKQLFTDAQNQINAGIKSVIGDQGFAQLSTYEQTMPQRNVVNELQQRLSYTATPLTPAQAEQMVQILAANTPQRQPVTPSGSGRSGQPPGATPPGGRSGPPPSSGFSSRGPDMGGMIPGVFGGGPGAGMMIGGFDGGTRGSAPVTSAAVNQAHTVLAPPQVAALQQIQQQQQTQQQLRQLVSDTLNANQPAKSGGSSSKSPGGAAPAAPGSSGPSPSRRRAGG
ncbi:MAG: hypothetical protein ACREH8_08765 [Opitutaceae bacterium]